ncbi:MAG: hypothetical protein V4736_15095 [Bdellovibrionota bacterium]
MSAKVSQLNFNWSSLSKAWTLLAFIGLLAFHSVSSASEASVALENWMQKRLKFEKCEPRKAYKDETPINLETYYRASILQGMEKLAEINQPLAAELIKNITSRKLKINCDDYRSMKKINVGFFMHTEVPVGSNAFHLRPPTPFTTHRIYVGDLGYLQYAAYTLEKENDVLPPLKGYGGTFFHEFLHFAGADSRKNTDHNDINFLSSPQPNGTVGYLHDVVYSCSAAVSGYPHDANAFSVTDAIAVCRQAYVCGKDLTCLPGVSNSVN